MQARPWQDTVRLCATASMQQHARLAHAAGKKSHAAASAAIEHILLELRRATVDRDAHVAGALMKTLTQFVGTAKVPQQMAGEIRLAVDWGDAGWDWARPKPRCKPTFDAFSSAEEQAMLAFVQHWNDAWAARRLAMGLACRFGSTERDLATIQTILQGATSAMQAWLVACPEWQKTAWEARTAFERCVDDAIAASAKPGEDLRLEPLPLSS